MTVTLTKEELRSRVFSNLDYIVENPSGRTPPGWSIDTNWKTDDPREIAIELAAWAEEIAPYASASDIVEHVIAWQAK